MGTFPAPLRHSQYDPPPTPEENPMVVTATQITPLVAIAAGVLILIIPRLLNYIVALYLIFVGFVQLNDTHHWVRFGTSLHGTSVIHLTKILTLLHV
jgi:hypothetical protein